MTLFDGWRPAAVVFDCDGLLMDTEPCWTVAEREVFARRGLPFGVEQKELVIGRSIEQVGVAIAGYLGEPAAARSLSGELLGLVTEVVTRQAQAMAGAHALVELVQKAVPVAVASNSPRALLDAALARGGFAGTFGVSIAADEVAEPKPAPGMYLTACRRLGVEPAAALAFEDSATGLRSARAAGVRVVGVPSLPGRPLDADVVVGSLLDPGLTAWIGSWS